MNNTFGLGPLDRLEQELGLGQPLQNANRGIAADQGSEYQLPDVDIGQQPRQQGQQSSATYQQQQVDTRQPQQPMMNGSSGLLPPQPLVSAFESASTKHDVPVNVLMALAQQESSYNANAKGPQTKWGNAKGMMQYLDSTAKMMGINPYDPIQSIDAAAKQIRQRLDKGYSMEDAVKEHFAGPNRNLWGAKTKQYGIDVMGKAARIADEMYGHLRPENIQAQEALDTAFAEQEARLSEPVNTSNEVRKSIFQIGLPSGDELVDGDRLHTIGRTRFEQDIANGWQNLAKIAPNDDLGKRLQEQSNYLQEEAKKNLSRTEQLTLRNDMALFERELSAYNQTVDNYNAGLERLQELDKQFDETYNQQELRPREVTWYEKIGNWLPQGSYASNAFKNIPKGWRNAKAEATISDVLAEGREGETDDTMPYFQRLKGGAAEGFNNMVDALGTTKFILAGGDSDQMAEALSTKMTEQAEREKRRSAGDLQIRSTFGAVSDAEGGSEIIGSSIYALGSILRNAEDFGITIAEQAGNMIPTIAGGLGGAATGAAGGAAVGGAPGASVGAIYGGSAGMMAGTAAIEVGFETEEMIMNRLSENGLPPTKENIKAILDDPEFISEAREQGLKKGITLAAVDQLFMAIGGAVASRPFRQAGQQALTEIPKPKFRTKVKAGFQGFGIDVVGEGAAEAASQHVARGEIDAGDVLLETAAGFGSSMITTPVAAGAAILNDRVKNRGQAGVPPIPIDSNTRQPIDEIVEEVPEQPSGPTSRAARAGELAAGQQLSEEQTAADSRVVVSSPTANISGFLDDYQEDGEGGFTARVLGDDGTTYQFTQNDPINIVPEAQFLAEQEALAEQVASGNIDPETGEVLTTDETSSESLLVDEEVPTTSIQTEPTTEESQESVALVDESESLTDEQKLVRSLAYFTEQARINGGWNELLSIGRSNAQEGLSVIPPSEVIPLATDVTTPNGNPLFEVFYPAIGQNVLVREDQWNNRNNLSDGLPYFDHQGRRGRLHSIRPEEIAGIRNSTNQTAKPIEAPQEQAPETVDAVAEATKPVSTMDVEDVEFIESHTPSMDFEQEALAASEPVTSQVGVSTTDTQEQVIGDVLVDEAIEPVIEATEASEPSSIEQQAAAQAERTKDRTERIKSATSLDEWRDIINEQSADPSPTGSNPNEFVQASKRAYDRLNGQLEKRRNRAIEEIEQEGNIKWFGSEEKAQEYLDKNGLNELYDANQKPVYGVRRFVIERKGVDYPSEYSEEQLENDVNAAQTWDNAEVDLKQDIIRRGKVGKTNQELTFNQLPRKVQERVIGAIARIESEQPTEVSAESVELPTEVAELPTEVTELATEVVEEVSTPSPDSDLFANNTLFTSDAVEKARARLRSKLRNANSGIDPEVLVDGMTIAGAYIEAGVRNFTDYANRMVSDLGDDIKPYLLSFWEGARNYPNLNTENMTSVDDSYKLHQEILNPQDLNNPAIGEINEISDTESGSTSATTNTSATRASGSPRAAKKAAPKRAKTQKALRRDGRLKQDYGVTHIDGFSDNNSGRETGSATKDAFLKDTKRYLDGVKDQLEELGYTPYTNDKGKNITPVSINEGGDAVSGEVTLNMQGPNGVGAYIVVGDSALRGTVPTTASGVSIMMRTNDASDIYRGHANRWVSTELTGAELANLADGYVKLKEAANEQSNERVQAPNRVGVSAVDTGRTDNAQQAPTQGDIGNVEVTESENVPQVTEPTDGEEVSLRPATEDVAEEGRASASRLSDDGRTRASGSGISDARARESERADVTRQRDSDSVKDPKTVSPSNQGAGDLVIADPMAIVGGGQEARFSKNQEAIELRNTLIDEARKPTKDEQEVLAGYTGWGSFGQELFQGSWNNPQPKKGWESRDKWLRDNLGQAEWEGMQRSIINAHYTDPPTVMAMWDMMKRMGFDGGRVLEPSIGIGNFFGMMPRELSSRSQRTGIELDPVTGSMAQMIYPKSNIQIMGYEKSNTPDNFYDVVIGNWPFANISPADRRYNRFSPMLHDYFFLKALDQTRPGGIVMGITSKGTMDKVDSRVRYELAKKGELVAAFRLPSGAFQGYAGTSVVTDIIILRKRTEPESVVTNDGWIKSVPYKTPSGPEVNLNEYYVANPSHVLGTIDAGRGMYRQDEMIVNRPDNLMERLRKAVDSVPEGAYHTDTRGESISYIANHTDDRTNALIQQDGQFYVVQGEHLLNANDDVLKYKVKSDKTTADREAQFSKLINMRKLYGELIELERGNSDAEPKRKELKDVYEAFKSEHGNYSESYGLNYLSKIDDPFYPALAALENTQEVNGETVYNPAAILTESTIRSKVRLENPSIIDAFVLARNDSVNPSPERVAELSGASVDDVKRELVESGAAFEEPGGDLVPSDIYLSGNIRQKLRQAQAGLENGNEAMRRNIEALEAVMPEDIPYYKIETQLGATWIPTTTYEEFVAHMLGLSDASDIKATFIGGSWKIDFPSNLNHRTEAKTGFGTPRYDFKKLVNAAISNQSINIRVKDEDGSTFIDQEATNEVNARIAEMRQRFAEWLWSDPNRQVDLEFEYNESRNPYATPKFDGSFLGFEGMSLTLGNGPFNLREHQVNAIWRALVTKKSLNAHEVGTGKTFTMGGIAVESRRYGIAKKPLLFAHNANSRSVANEIQMMYPASKILYVDNLSSKNIKTRMMQIANDDWDVVVFPHSLIDRIGFKEETLMNMAQQQLDELEQAAKEAAIDDGTDISDDMLTDPDELKKLRSVTAKELVKQRLNILETIKKLSQQSSRENAIAFEDLGVDMVLVDECFSYDTLIETDLGFMPIGYIVENKIEVKVKSMDSYTHEVQWKPVINWFKNRRKKELIEVFHEKGSFVCTPEHKIWVQGQGYKEAGKLLPSDKLIVRNGGYSEASKEGANYNDLRMVQDGNFLSKEQAKEVLQRILQDASSTQQSRFTPEVEEFHGENMEKLTTQRESQSICIRNDEKQQPYVERGIKKKSVGNPQKDWSSTKHKGWEWETHKATNIACRKDRLCDGACCFDKADKTSNGKASELIQDRFSMRRIENSDRDRWAESQLNEDENIGCKERESFISSGLVGIAVLKQDSDGEYRFGGREHTFVYDIEVEENHNYFANGVLVSNCHEFKKPPISTKMKIKGLQTQTSNKSIAMSFITKYVRSMNNGGNVHLFTGTPITNTMTEIYHMQRYLMQEEMEEAGLSDWDGWFGSFARETEDVELTSTGEYEKITRLQSFINVPELRRMIGQYMDVVFSDDMPEMQPRVVDGKQLNDPDLTESEQAAILNGRTEGARDRPYKRIVNESSDMSAEQNVVFSRVQQWANTWRNMSGKDRKEAMAKGSPEVPIIYDGVAERASFDVRLVNGIENAGKEGSEEMTPHPQSKPARVVKNLIDIYNSDERATQVVFMEQGMSDVVTRSEGEPGNKQQVRYKSFSTLKDMIERLVQQGIPRERIATVTGSTSKEKRAEIADMMNRGEIRIVFGSTQSLGVGVNMQRNLRAMHHMDAPWMPGDLEQRNGRGHRQGNQWNTVLEYRYLTDRLDGRRWQVLAIKQRFINDFMRSKGNERVIDGDAVGDEQGDILSTFSEAAGDPRILVREKLKGKIDGLKSRERMNNRAKADGRNQLGRLKNEVQRDNERLQELKRSGAIKKVSDLINNQLGDKFKATIFGQSFNSSTAARDFVRDKMASNIRLGEDKQIGTYGNVPLHAYWNQFRGEPNLYIDIGNETIESNGPSLPSLASALRDFRDNEESNLVKGINDKMATIERLENVINEPFHMANELARAEKQLDNLETDLSLNPFAPPYWLRSGAPVDTNVMWQGKEFLVTGHRWNNDGYFVLAEDDSGAVAIPYLEAKDGQGMQVYEEQAFEAPKVVTNDKESDKVDMSVISNPLAHIDADSINDRLRTGELGNVMGRLLDSGQVTIHATTDSLPDNVVSNGLAIQGYTERATGKIHLIAENLTVDSALPVVMHELVHANGKSLLGENRWNNLMARGQAYLNSAMIRKSEGTVNPESFWDRALNRVETAKAEGLIQDGREAEEFLAYTLEEYQRAPEGIKKWASNLVGVVKDWLSRNFNIQLGSVTPGQLRALAINAAKQSRSRQPDIPNSDISYSVNGRRVLPTSTNIRTDDGQPLVRFFYPSEGIHVLIREDDWYSGADELPTYNYKGEPTAGLQTINRSRLVTALRRPDDPFRDAEEAAEMEFYELPEIPESAYVNNNSNVPTSDDIDAYFESLDPEDIAFAEREAAIEESNAAQSRAAEVKPNDIVKENGKPLNNKEKEQFLDEATEFLEREDLSEPQSMVRGDFIGQATKDMVGARSLYTKFMVHPYQVASLYPEFTPVFDVSTRQNQTRNKIIEDLHQDHVLYQQLSQKSKANVNKALELGRLTYQAWSKEEVKAGVNNRGFNYTVEMDDQGKPKRVRKDFKAQLSKAGDTIKLNDAEADAYVALRNMFDRALDMFRDQMLEEMGLGWLNTHEGEGRPLVLRELEDGRIVLKGTVYDAETKKALDEAVSPVEIRNILANHPILSVVKNVTKGVYSKEHGGYVYAANKRGQLESELENFLGLSIEEQILSLKKEGMTPERLEFYDNVARAVGDIEQSKRTGYVPFTRYGDYVIAVKERIHDIKYRTSDTGEIYATDVPDSLNDFLDDIGAEYDHVIGGWLLSERQQDRLERENENTIYSEKVETGLRDMFGNNSERNVKMRKGKVTDIKSVKDAMARIERDYIVGHENRRITSFETAKKNTSGEVDFTGIDVLAETAMIDTATWEAVRNQLVKAMGSKGFRSHFFQSSNVPGYSPDFERSIADYIVGLSGYLARRRHSAEWDNAISNVQGEKLHKYATSYRNYSNEPSEEYALLRQTGFFMYIAGNISSAFLNATQVALMTMPILSMVSNSARATAEAARAYKDAIAMVRANKTTGFDIFDFTKAPDDVRSSLIKAGQEGLLLPLQALEIMGVAGRRSVKGRQAQRRYDTAVQTLALPFTFAERLNRIVTFIAAHRIASKDGYNANIRRIFRNNPQAQMMMAKEGYSPYSFAEFVVDETQFRMGKANRPTAMRNVGAAIFQFKSFMLQFFEALYRNGTIHGKEGKKAVAATLAMMVALSGLWGLPGAEDLMELFEGMYRHITKRDKDLRTDLRKFVFETTNSNFLASLVDGGFPYAGGVDMRGRIGMGQIMPETQSPTGIDWLDTAVSLGGIPADILVGRPVRALQASSSGEYGRAATELLPNFVENQRKAVQWQLDGVRTRDGRMVMPKDDVNTSSKYMKFFGFQPSQVSDVYAANFAKTRAQSSADNLQRYYVDQYVRLLGAISRSQNPEQTAKLQGEASDLINEVYEQNEKLPPHQRINLNRSTINNAFRREQQGFGSGRGRGASAANSASIDEAFGINND